MFQGEKSGPGVYLRTKSSIELPRAAEPGAPLQIRVLGTGRTIPVRGRRMTLGSSMSNHVALTNDPYISKHHCALTVADDELWIEDQGSRNGTWVNNVRVERCRLQPGSRVVVGRTGLQLIRRGQETRPYGIVGCHPATQRVVAQIERVATSMRPVLVHGETGTGKELVARAIHTASPCRLAVFEPLNCGAIPRDLAESELFGHAQGAFTGADRAHRGAFERADGGTLFLDEVGELAPELQPKLLRVLEEGVVRPVGDEARRAVDVRIVAATHRDLLADTERGRFRLDLYHRLAVASITIPPLRERPEDIPLLVQHFLAQELAERGVGVVPRVTDSVMEFLQQQPWFGNVRELRSAVQRALLEGGDQLTVEHFSSLRPVDRGRALRDHVRFRGRKFADIRRDIYQRVLQEQGGNHTAAAAVLGIPKSTFFDQLRAMERGGAGGKDRQLPDAVVSRQKPVGL